MDAPGFSNLLIVVAIGLMDGAEAAALVAAGLLSLLIFPALGLALLRSAGQSRVTT